MGVKKRGLGKGLDALLGAPSGQSDVINYESSGKSENLRELPVENIQRGRYQPRKHLEKDALDELALSIRQQGLLQPIVVRPISDSNFEIIAGERRWRACKSIGMLTITAVVRDVGDDAAIAMALIENLQREDLNPMEEAEALSRLQTEFNLTQAAVAEAVGKSRSSIANLLRLTSLHHSAKSLLESGKIDMGHAKAILSLQTADQRDIANRVVEQNLSVRQTEKLVRALLTPKKPRERNSIEPDPDVERLKMELTEKLGSKVDITYSSSGKGKLEIYYNNLNELQGILSYLKL